MARAPRPDRSCRDARTTLSARLDGEPGLLGPDDLAAHLAGCAGCRAHAADLDGLRELTRRAASEPVPDLVDDILASAPEPGVRPARDRRAALLPWLRLGLALVAVVMLVDAIPFLVGDPGTTDAHTDHVHHTGDDGHGGRHSGVFDAALAIGLLVVAYRPRRASGLVPMVGALAALMFVTALVDSPGDLALVIERAHLVQFSGALLVWLVARGERAEGRALAEAA